MVRRGGNSIKAVHNSFRRNPLPKVRRKETMSGLRLRLAANLAITSVKETEERYWDGERIRIEEARRRRDEYLEEERGRQD
jgi:hypothetical protein